MAGIIILGFLTAAAIEFSAAYVVVFTRYVGFKATCCYLLLAASAVVTAIWGTFFYVYYASDNLRIVGWPVPTMVFERKDANSPWLDFVGPTIFLGLPMNFMVFILLPSILVLGIATWRWWTFKRQSSRRIVR